MKFIGHLYSIVFLALTALVMTPAYSKASELMVLESGDDLQPQPLKVGKIYQYSSKTGGDEFGCKIDFSASELPLQTLKALAPFSRNIFDLDLADNNLSFEHTAFLPNFTNLRVLSLENCGIGERALKQISSLTNLEELNIAYNVVRADAINHILGLSKLKYLDCGANAIGDAGVERLTHSASQISFLDVRVCSLTDAALPNILKIPGLQRVNLNGNEFSASVMPAFLLECKRKSIKAPYSSSS